MSTSICKCGNIRRMNTAGPNAQNPGREYFKCSDPKCNQFDWADRPSAAGASGGGATAAAARGGAGYDNGGRFNHRGTVSQETGPDCKCEKATVQRIVKKEGPNKGRMFWTCASYPKSCGFFKWQEDKPSPQDKVASPAVSGVRGGEGPASHNVSQETSPPCKCKKAAIQRTVKKEGPTKGRTFWSCATFPKGCDFFEWQKDKPSQGDGTIPPVTPSPKRKRPALEGYATRLTDRERLETIEKLMTVNPDDLVHVNDKTYDSLKVVGLWKITNPSRLERYETARSRIKEELISSSFPKYEIPNRFAEASVPLGLHPLERNANEVFLLHGTPPRYLHSVLFEGLDPQVANDCRFGRGVYFAESAAKIDQYATADHGYAREGQELHDLHVKLYGNNLHPKNVHYCLVSRVLLGSQVATKNGTTQHAVNSDSASTKLAPLFADINQSTLAPVHGKTPHSLLALPGERERKFREFVVFNGEQVFSEYLVAYQRVRRLCDCGIDCVERTVTKNGPNYGRTIIFCGKKTGKREEDSGTNGPACNFMRMMPLCHCLQTATSRTSHTASNPNRQFYTCCYKGSLQNETGQQCEFFEWADSGTSGKNSAAKRLRFD